MVIAGGFKIILVPSRGKQVWSLRVPKLFIPALFAAALLFVVVLVAGTTVLLRSAERRMECSRLGDENRLLVERLQGMEATIDGLMASVERSAEFQQRARVLANMDDVEGDTMKMGIGGPVFSSADPLSKYDPNAATLALDFEGRLEELEDQCRYQEEGFSEILKRLEDQKDRWAHTPSINPVASGWPTSGFGKRRDPFTNVPTMHLGLDLSATKGSPVYAAADGKVITAGWHRNFGRIVEIDHGNGIVTRYAHNDKLKVKRGQSVTRGQIIATVGRSGRATAPHVHYEVRVNGSPVNPWRYILSSEVVVD